MTRNMRTRARQLPWWAIVLTLFFTYATYRVLTDDQYVDILKYMIDDPQTSTQDKYNVVYEVETKVQVIADTLTLKLADDSRADIAAEQVVERGEGSLECDKEADPNCVNQFGELITFRVPLNAGEEPAGTYQEQGLMRPLGGIVDLPNGEVMIVAEENIIAREQGVLPCNSILNPGCENLEGEIITFEVPYSLETGLLVREDVIIRHEDGYTETVRPNRLENWHEEDCEGASDICHLGKVTYASFSERVIGTEIGRTDKTIKIRTVDEQTVAIPRERILNMTSGTVTCDLDANPRCQDFTGTIVERQGTVIEGELSLENNRSVSLIPKGQDTAIEVLKTSIVSETRTPENCRIEDEGACQISLQQADDVVAGRIVEDNEQEIVVQTVQPVFVEIDRESAVSLRRSPMNCALNNLRGCNSGIWLTLLVTFTAYGLALIIGLLVGLMRVSSNMFLYHASTLYVELIRGTPLLVLLLFFAFVIGPTLRDMGGPPSFLYRQLNKIEVGILGEESFLSEAVLGLAIGYGAFLAEVFRAGIQTIGRGQMEAARSLGMTYFQAMRHVILPQAIRVVLPPLGNDFIAMLKDSALISVLALPDMLQNGRLYITRTFQPIPVYVVIALLYISLTLVLSYLVRAMEKRMRMV